MNMITSLHNKLSSLVAKHILGPRLTNKPFTWKSGEAVPRALLRYLLTKKPREHARLEAKCDITAEEKIKYYQQLNELNQALGVPVKVQGDVQALTLLDWLSVEKTLLSIQMEQADHVIIPEARAALRKAAPPFTLFNIVSDDSLPVLYLLSLNAVALAVTGMAALIDPFIPTPVLATIHIGATFTVPVFMVAAAYSGTSGGAALKFLQSHVSSTWEQVFKEESPADAILLGAVAQLYEKLDKHQLPHIQLKEMSPREAMQLCAHLASSSENVTPFFDSPQAMMVPLMPVIPVTMAQA